MKSAQVQQVRRFNRVVTQRVGALEESYLRRGRPLGEARLIFEIGANGAEIRVLRDRLGLDSGYLSRLLRSLEAQGLVRVGGNNRDRRSREARLTAKGHAELAAYDELSDALAQSMLTLLSSKECARLVAAMAEIEYLFAASAIEIAIEPPSSADARRCLAEYFKELAQRFEAGFDPAKSNPANVDDMTPPAGCFVVARLARRPVGCGALKRKSKTIGEIKRMWTAPDARGRGVARRVLERLEAEARGLGLRKLRLETNRTLKEAQALYRKLGYEEVAAFNDEPYAHHWFEKKL
jgi:DNA-binding MarR family transcriptional regulator/N-acetylglutamate synthase-like GNAT family acetyltransferase